MFKPEVGLNFRGYCYGGSTFPLCLIFFSVIKKKNIQTNNISILKKTPLTQQLPLDAIREVP